MLLALKRADMDVGLYLGDVGPDEAEEGWAYFETLKDNYGGMSLPTFQEQVQKALRRAIKEIGETNAARMLAMQVYWALGSMGMAADSDFEERVTNAATKLIQKMHNATPVFATAVFRLFGK